MIWNDITTIMNLVISIIFIIYNIKWFKAQIIVNMKTDRAITGIVNEINKIIKIIK